MVNKTFVKNMKSLESLNNLSGHFVSLERAYIVTQFWALLYAQELEVLA